MKDGKIVHPASRPILLPAQAMKIAQVPICARDMFETCLFSPTKEREREEKSSFLLLRLVGGSEGRAFMQTRRRRTGERGSPKKRHFFWAATATHPLPSMLIFLRWETGRGEGHGHASPLLLSLPPPLRPFVLSGRRRKGKGGRGRRFAALMAHPHPQPGGEEDASFISCV